jgi:hypothetical protein
VEATPYGWGAVRLNIENVSYLTMENIHIKGGNAINPLIKLNAPSVNFRFTHCDITHSFYYIFQMESVSEAVNDKPEISHCYFDTNYSLKEGFVNSENNDGSPNNNWNTTLTEGITMRDGVDGAWIHHNTFRQMGHAFIAIENLDFSDTFESAVEAKQVATQEKQRAKTQQEQQTMEAEQAAARKKIEAEAAAEVVRIRADAEAYEIKTKADAEAEANEKIAATVTEELIDYTQAQNWNGKLPSTFIGSGSAIPVIQTDPVGTPAEDEEDSAE